MRLKKWNVIPAIVAAVITVGPITVSAQVLTVLHSFNGTDGQLAESALVQGSDGNFYGTTALGGMFYQGTLFRITPAGAVTVLHSFSGLLGDGSVPMGGLVQTADGSFFGTTALGGTHSMGTVFRTALGIVVTLHSFSGAPGEGANPTARLVRGSDGNFYGTTALGGGHYLGTVFKITSAGNLTTLHSFSGSSGEGADPLGGLVQGSDGNFYGTTALGGAHYLGTIFKITPAGSLTTLYSLSGSPGEGADPLSALVQGGDGNFYGTTALGGAHYWGTVFKFSASAPAPLL